MVKITALLPAYNEEISIGSMVIKTKKHVDEVIVIDDGSTDATAKIAEVAGAKVIKHESNLGKGAALKTGFEAVDGADVVVTIDADGQHSPSEIPKLITPIINGETDVVNGSRYINGGEKNTPTYRRVGQSVLDIATNINGRTNITDSQSGFRAFAAHTIPVFRFHQNGFGIESEMLTDASNAGLRIEEVSVSVEYHENSHKKNPLSHGVGVLVKVLQDMQFKRPIYYFTIPGLVLIVVGLAAGLVFFGQYLGDPNMGGPSGPGKSLATTVLAGLVTITGVFIAFTGIILDSMTQMIKENMMHMNK
ncbi:glycosyltransferase family 2 protein [Methanobacterium paludis]|uniref:Glycosyl transferase family 2 n=1 Tax=Methanobacterium paludis (strain DSM 25820 / JCM 18151 / SWAN1) TaxID=868131 RepID=F6D737_METPW|nr:glycosyltransferase family 2 protein [Methanobacterium paludis]AEG18404.1 glycosyl transferase family 2 [Methanobacterium paludis]